MLGIFKIFRLCLLLPDQKMAARQKNAIKQAAEQQLAMYKVQDLVVFFGLCQPNQSDPLSQSV